ncbi:winged helix-turn-helix domain-containing protein [Halalkalicoccus subterraneus]|uniref:winged helix-turn-helix domain-containing protein n=1 Tax=Halalkalicoccus subterraneus TaxID=2675002 RepID=UPI000EFC3203|nr:helix-turn-helix domain-containing protein [Halalkalicoccus subterraneus]
MSNRTPGGQFSPSNSDDEFVAAVRTHEPAATSEVADELGVTRQNADQRLRKLDEAGRVNRKKIGASLVWFLPSDTDESEGLVS